ncbi:MAG: hypothetical protein COV10_01095 [Candidatus Vogelbacteria bacterium CG10_big_fil_rev_8_21_14_0_10_51_16]|uniref:ATPase n=1 Tax=Candidatus Vogelbacteria bacterium CG10_big_fil_rev_8_21_14_0_10_51_16 TaxID=1975045 RepID=A0A2H0RGG3_9BACT|nr:MAG: hypothetical protein COV10_01095 [Candidatus Vogelbacteria bacterium CG10_big_fil_rev_8_21_14_0_10_51_16]
MKYLKRALEEKIRLHINDDKVIVLTGMRRVGKSTLLRQIASGLSNMAWFDFDNPLDVRLFTDIDYNDIYERILVHGKLDKSRRLHIFVDEAQMHPEVSKVAKYLHDHYDVKFFLTGSASYYLKNLFPESLAGRKVLLELFPLSFSEFVEFKGGDTELLADLRLKESVHLLEFEKYDSLYDEYLRWGGFPEIVLATSEVTKRELAKDIFSSYYQKEVVQLGGWHKQDAFRDLMVLLATRVGSQLDLTKISQELGVTRPTLTNYISFLEATYFISLLGKYSGSVDRTIAGSKKVYLCDNGILRVVAETDSSTQLENSIYHQLAHFRAGQVHYYRNQNGKELDFVVDGKVGYEVKSTATSAYVAEAKRLARGAGLKESIVVSKNYTEEGGGVHFAQFI